MKFVKCRPNEKEPDAAKGETWKISDDPSPWFAQGFNAGLLLKESNRVVLDFDGVNHVGGKDLAREFYKKYAKLCSFIVGTAADNVHFHFKGTTKTRKFHNERGEEIGDIKATGYVLWIGSQIRGKFYHQISGGELLPFPEHLFPIEQKETKQQAPIDENDPIRRLMRARAWLKKREGGEDGNGRGLQMIKTCRALFGMFGLTEDQVWPLILEFNERNVPPYTEKQLRHKIEDSKKGK